MNVFTQIILEVFQKECKTEYKVKQVKENVIEISFSTFALILYYNPYEFDLGINYYRKKSNNCLLSFDAVLLKLGCQKSRIPNYVYISNEKILYSYLKEYVFLLNTYYKELENYFPK